MQTSSSSQQVDLLTDEQTTLLKRFIDESPQEEIESARFRVESVESAALRFLRGRQFDLAKAKTLLHEAFAKKQEHRVSEKLKLSAEELARCDLETAKNWYPHSMPGFDKFNRPILFEHTGQITPSVLSIMTTKEWLVDYHWWAMENSLNEIFEQAFERSKALNVPMSFTTCVILDFAGLNSTHCSKSMLDHVKGLVAIDNCCYPEILGKMLVINAPWLTVGLWNLIKGWLDPCTQAKIEILSPGAQSLNRLRDYVDVNILPTCYGGNGSPFHTPKPDTEMLSVPRGGHMRKTVSVPAGHQLLLDSYVAEGTIEFCAAVVDTVEPQHYHGMAASAGSNHFTYGSCLVKQVMTGNGTPVRFKYECPTAESDRLIVISWYNSSRFTTRYVVYTFRVVNPMAKASISSSLTVAKDDATEISDIGDDSSK
jgi:hypothetical protein